MSLWLALHLLIGFPLGLLASNAFEWWMHKYVLHGMGKKKGNFWNFHWYEHHAESRRNDMIDPAYEGTWVTGGWNARSKEGVLLLGGALLWIPMLYVIPGFASAAIFSTCAYYYCHKKSHIDSEWGRKHLPWHVDHHMGVNQDANWCVTFPWWDILRGTREPYVGTDRERADREKRANRASRRETAVLAEAAEIPN